MSDKHSLCPKKYWVYILICSNHSYYTGYTDNLEKRFLDHVSGKGSKYTRSFKPLSIAQQWKIDGDKALAMRIERGIKKLSKKHKEHLIQNPDDIYRFVEIAVKSGIKTET